MRVFVIVSGVKEPLCLEIENPSNEKVEAFKERIAAKLGTENIRVLYKGRVLDHEERTLDQFLPDGCSVYVSIVKPPASHSQVLKTTTTEDKEENPLQKMMMRKLQESLEGNPEIFQQMMMQNPAVKAMIDKDPEMGKRLMDPELAEQAMKMAMNPQAMQAFMQSQERAISQIENMPQGFQYLRQMYQSVDALSDEPQATSSSSKLRHSQPTQGVTTEPLANPWAKSAPKSKVVEHKEKYAGALERLREMGFTDDRLNVKALVASDGDLDLALDFIENNMSE